MLAENLPMLFGACEDEVLSRQFSPDEAGSVGPGSSPQTRPECDSDSSRLDAVPETPNPPLQRTLADARLSRLHSSPGEGENRSDNPFPMIRLAIEAAQRSAAISPSYRPAQVPAVLPSPPVPVVHMPQSACAEDEVAMGSSVHVVHPPDEAIAHAEDRGGGAGAGSDAEAGAVETGGGGAGAAQALGRILPKGITRGCLRVRAREEEGGEGGAGDAEQGRGDKKRRVMFSDVCEEHEVPQESRRNEDVALDVSQPHPVSEPATG